MRTKSPCKPKDIEELTIMKLRELSVPTIPQEVEVMAEEQRQKQRSERKYNNWAYPRR